jgi:hypothetical protein
MFSHNLYILVGFFGYKIGLYEFFFSVRGFVLQIRFRNKDSLGKDCPVMSLLFKKYSCFPPSSIAVPLLCIYYYALWE